MMRRILVDHARRRRAGKRGGPDAKLSFDEARESREGPVDLIALDDALRELERFDEREVASTFNADGIVKRSRPLLLRGRPT
jgi:hypothetical protein